MTEPTPDLSYEEKEQVLEQSQDLADVQDSNRAEPIDRKTHRVRVYLDESGEYRWRRTSGNNKTIAVSGEGYKNLAAALASLHLANDPPFVVVYETEQDEPEQGDDEEQP
ncbi:DUF1508 domain-containing protein [Actinoplanes sp. NPDC049668]|uniref:DUF1508 domain-containing protein n=1 Tax=unclassified Actinoplanes TaxID=2626549 RepID=UPI0033B23529